MIQYLTIEEVIAINYTLVKRYSIQEIYRSERNGRVRNDYYATKTICFHHANKRTAVLALLVFLKRNDYLLKVEDKELEDITVNVAVNAVSKEEVVDWLWKHSVRC